MFVCDYFIGLKLPLKIATISVSEVHSDSGEQCQKCSSLCECWSILSKSPWTGYQKFLQDLTGQHTCDIQRLWSGSFCHLSVLITVTFPNSIPLSLRTYLILLLASGHSFQLNWGALVGLSRPFNSWYSSLFFVSSVCFRLCRFPGMLSCS